jgi:hypothetical protein
MAFIARDFDLHWMGATASLPMQQFRRDLHVRPRAQREPRGARARDNGDRPFRVATTTPLGEARSSTVVRQTTMQVERGASMREAEMADEIAKRFSGAGRSGIGCIEPLYRRLGLPAQA